jgi:hypothetical protein
MYGEISPAAYWIGGKVGLRAGLDSMKKKKTYSYHSSL